MLPDEGMCGDEVVGGRRPLRGVQSAALGHEGVEGRRQRPRAVRLHQRQRRLQFGSDNVCTMSANLIWKMGLFLGHTQLGGHLFFKYHQSLCVLNLGRID